MYIYVNMLDEFQQLPSGTVEPVLVTKILVIILDIFALH